MSNTATRPDINNLVLSDDVLEGFDPNANQFAAPPPVKAGLYTASLSFATDEAEKRWFPIAYNAEKYPAKAGKTYSKTRLIGTLIQPGGEFDGRRVQDPFCSTGIFGNQSTSKVASLIHLFGRGEDLNNVRTDGDLRSLFEECLAAEPQVRVVTDFEWTGSKEGGYQIIRGKANFPVDENGNIIPVLKDPATGEDIAGYAVIVKYLAAA